MSTEVTGGQMTWSEALAGPLNDATCLWQDLDGLHAEPPPPEAPPTSILWGWRDDALIRVRLDGKDAFIAVVSSAQAGVRTVPWDLRPYPDGDGRVAGIRGPAVTSGAMHGAFEQVIVAGPGDATGPITFVRPASNA
jgi:hypothetical protein